MVGGKRRDRRERKRIGEEGELGRKRVEEQGKKGGRERGGRERKAKVRREGPVGGVEGIRGGGNW